MRAKILDVDRLNNWLQKKATKSTEFKAVALKILAELDDLKKAAQLLDIPEKLLQKWLNEWNEIHRHDTKLLFKQALSKKSTAKKLPSKKPVAKKK